MWLQVTLRKMHHGSRDHLPLPRRVRSLVTLNMGVLPREISFQNNLSCAYPGELEVGCQLFRELSRRSRHAEFLSGGQFREPVTNFQRLGEFAIGCYSLM